MEFARLELEELEGTLVATFHGELDLSNADELMARVAAAAGRRRVVVDFTPTEFLDVATVRAVERLAWRRRVVAVAPPGTPAARLLGLVPVGFEVVAERS
jgi:hypothetical protein